MPAWKIQQQIFKTMQKIKNDFNASGNDIVFILSGVKKKVLTSLGQLRLKLADMFKMVDETRDEFLKKI